jgi:hypothetical protein
MKKLLNRESALILATTAGFYTTKAPDEIPDRYYELAQAVYDLQDELEEVRRGMGDTLSPVQYAAVMAAYAKLDSKFTQVKKPAARKTKTKGTK